MKNTMRRVQKYYFQNFANRWVHSCRCCCHRYFSHHPVTFTQLLRNFACALGIPSVTRVCSIGTTVLPHVKNGWATQNFWSAPRKVSEIKTKFLIFNKSLVSLGRIQNRQRYMHEFSKSLINFKKIFLWLFTKFRHFSEVFEFFDMHSSRLQSVKWVGLEKVIVPFYNIHEAMTTVTHVNFFFLRVTNSLKANRFYRTYAKYSKPTCPHCVRGSILYLILKNNFRLAPT